MSFPTNVGAVAYKEATIVRHDQALVGMVVAQPIIMLLLMGVWNYKNHTMQWERRRVDYSDSILYDNAQAVVFLAFVIGAAAFSVPSISWQDLQEAWRARNSNEAAEMLGIRKQSVSAKKPVVQEPSLPRLSDPGQARGGRGAALRPARERGTRGPSLQPRERDPRWVRGAPDRLSRGLGERVGCGGRPELLGRLLEPAPALHAVPGRLDR